MDNSDIYEYRFDELIKIMRRGKDSPTPAKSDDSSNAYVIDIAGDAFRGYESTIKAGECWAIYTLEHILMNLLDRTNIPYYIPEYTEQTYSCRTRPIRPFAFRMDVGGKSLAFVFRYRVTRGLLDMRETLNRFGDIDGIKFYLLNGKPSTEARCIELLSKIEMEDDASRITFAPIKAFFEEFLSLSEYESFIKHADAFNDRGRRLIGLQTMPLPTKETVEEFKSKISDYLEGHSESFAAMLPTSMDADQRAIFVRNYYDHRLYRAMVGESTFADSFVSSEWSYETRTPTEELDQTGIVTGYLKSVEQLLEATLRAFIQAGTVSSCDDSDTTLGTLIHRVKHFRHNRNVCAVNGCAIRHLIDELYKFKDVERNRHLHNKNIFNEETIDSIRQQAMYLHFLILGAFRIDKSAYVELGIPNDDQATSELSTETLYGKFRHWIEPLVLFDTPVKAGAIALMLMRFSERSWELTYQVLHEIREEDYKELSWNYRMISSSSMTNNLLRWNADWPWGKGVSSVATLFKRFIASSSPAAEKLKTYQQVVLGNRSVIEVLYKRQ